MKNIIKTAINELKNEESIIFPTDTVYGLLCKYNSKTAVEKIYKLKKRTRKKPLILLGYNWKALKPFVKAPKDFNPKEYWPGATTIVLPATKKVPGYLNKGYKTIGIRIPGNQSLRELINKCPGKVLASTSANISGKSDRIPQKDLVKKVNLFVKAKNGEMSFKPSTVIKLEKNKTKVLR